MDPHQKTMMVQSFVAAFAKAARVSNVPEEAIMSDTCEPSYMFLAAEWNRSSVSERAYLLALLFGREFEVEAMTLKQIASLAMTMVEPDGSAALEFRDRRIAQQWPDRDRWPALSDGRAFSRINKFRSRQTWPDGCASSQLRSVGSQNGRQLLLSMNTGLPSREPERAIARGARRVAVTAFLKTDTAAQILNERTSSV